jgi:4'-phosphopantetheinyl transferase
MAETVTFESKDIAYQPVDGLNSSRFMDSDDILWPRPPVRWCLGANDVHVWAAPLDMPPDSLSRLASMLSEEEKQRATRFRSDTHRNRFVAARGILRTLLGGCLDCGPDELKFDYGPTGKPALAGRYTESGLSFNVAHSQSLGLVAITRRGPIGVDVEFIRPMSDASGLVERFFSARENALFQSLPDHQKNIAFFNLWTRKEAWLKATGQGIAHSLNRVEVTFTPGEPARFLALPNESRAEDNWILRELLPAPGFVGAVAPPDSQFSISNFQFCLAEFL